MYIHRQRKRHRMIKLHIITSLGSSIGTHCVMITLQYSYSYNANTSLNAAFVEYRERNMSVFCGTSCAAVIEQ